MTAFLALVRKDIRLFFRDRRSVAMSFIAPIVIASFFGYVFGGTPRSGRKAAKIPVAFADEDGSASSISVAKKLAAEESIDLRTMTRDEAREEVRKGTISVAAVIPKGFGEQAGTAFFRPDSQKPELEFLYDPSKISERQMIEGMLTGKVMEAVSSEMFAGSSSSMIDKALADFEKTEAMPESYKSSLRTILQGVRKLRQENAAAGTQPGPVMSVPFRSKADAVTARKGQEYNGVAHSFAGMGVQFILFMGIEAGVALLLQRKMGLWKRFRSAPVSRAAMLGSRVVSSALFALMILAVMFLFARVAFGVRIEGSFAGFALVAVSFALMTAAFGLLIASLGKTAEAARPIAVLATLIMVMLGGAWVPTFIFPSWLQQATLIMPTRWAVDALDAMTWRGLGFDSALRSSAVIAGFAILFGAIALWRFRWEAE